MHCEGPKIADDIRKNVFVKYLQIVDFWKNMNFGFSQLQLLFRRVAGCSRSRKRACHVCVSFVTLLPMFEVVARIVSSRPGPPYSVGDRSMGYTNDFNRQTERPNTPGGSPIPKRCMTDTEIPAPAMKTPSGGTENC